MEAPWVLVHVLTDTLPSVADGHCAGPWKLHALRTVAPAYADQFLFQGIGVTTKVHFQIPQFRLDNPGRLVHVAGGGGSLRRMARHWSGPQKRRQPTASR